MNLYRLLRYSNDAKAALKGRLPQRIVRRAIFKQAVHVASFVSRMLRVAR